MISSPTVCSRKGFQRSKKSEGRKDLGKNFVKVKVSSLPANPGGLGDPDRDMASG